MSTLVVRPMTTAVVLALVASCSTIRTDAVQESVDSRVRAEDARTENVGAEDLRKEIAIERPAPNREARPEDLPILNELNAASDCLERHAPWRDAVGAPWKWGLPHAEMLSCELSELEPYLQRIEVTIRHPEFIAATLESRPRGIRTPDLGPIRNQVNVLCAWAILAAREGDFELAEERLYAAQTIPYLLNDGSEIGERICTAADGIVHQARMRMAEEL